MPRVSLLLADDVGLGKTVEAGLILTELLIRRRVRRVLILTPASLSQQWQRETKTKFALNFDLIDRAETHVLQRRIGLDANPCRTYPAHRRAQRPLRLASALGDKIPDAELVCGWDISMPAVNALCIKVIKTSRTKWLSTWSWNPAAPEASCPTIPTRLTLDPSGKISRDQAQVNAMLQAHLVSDERATCNMDNNLCILSRRASMSTSKRGMRAFAGSVCAFLALLPAVAQKSEPKIRWEHYTTASGLPSNRVLCVAADANRVWAGTDNGLFLIERGQVAKVYQFQDGLVSRAVTALAIDQNTGDLWIATYGGLSRYSAGIFQNYTSLTSGLANDIVYDVAVQDGFVWAATAAGLSRLDTRLGSWANFDNRNTPMMDPWPVAVSVNKGRAFVATWGSGVLEYNIAVDQWTSHRYNEREESERDDRATDAILDFATGVAYDSNSGLLWTATRSGLIRQDEHTWHRYTSADTGLASDFINALRIHDDKLWLCTKQGLSVFSLKTSKWITYHFFAASGNGGMSVVAENSVAGKHSEQHSPQESNVLNVAFHGADIWVASEAGLSVGSLGPAGYIERFSHGAGIPGQAVDARRRSPVALPSPRSSYSSKQTTVNIGFFGPVEGSPEVPYGFAMLHGAQLAIDEANDQGGHSDQVHAARLRYELKIHNDSALWGVSTTEPVSMALDEHVVAILGSIDGSATHTLLRVATELGIPVVNTGTTDPSITDTGASWLVHLFPDDRQQSRALARYVAGQKNIRTVGILREEARYARLGVETFREEVEQAGKISVTEATFQPGDTDFSRQLRQFRNAKIDGLVIWCRPAEGALILKQTRTSGIRIPAFGPSYLASPQLIELAGTAAEGFVATSVLNPARADKRWQHFQRNYSNKFGEYPDAYASYAYDGINLLIAAIEKTGPNREKIADALWQHRLNSYEGASGQLFFDGSLNNIAPPAMARVEGGKFVYWVPNAAR
jgi:ABC-type branched-subunit amino acid transport system substrate-binding protein